MHIKNKTVQFSVRDTYNLDTTLSPILFNALTKFKEVIIKHECKGTPSLLLAEMFPLKEGEYNWTEEQLEAADKKFLEILDAMIYAFDESKEPDSEDYTFNIEFVEVSRTEKSVTTKTVIDNQEQYDAYNQAKEDWIKKCEEGRYLLAKYWNCLWH